MLALRRVAGSVGRRTLAAPAAPAVRCMGTIGEELKGAPSKVCVYACPRRAQTQKQKQKRKQGMGGGGGLGVY
jgi:hypothetical protein